MKRPPDPALGMNRGEKPQVSDSILRRDNAGKPVLGQFFHQSLPEAPFDFEIC
jgi:hypothetical protein